MTQAFYTAIGGMAAGQTKITVVADNIANMNTIGFKASNVNFSDVYYRTSSTGQAPTGQMGGINPKQTGIGVQTASITRDFSAGTTLTTGLNTDLCINGSSFFTVASPTVEILYTRDGNFTVDADGHMVTSSGYKLLGTNNSLNTTSSTIPIKIPTYIDTVTTPSTAAQMNNKQLSDLNGIKSGGVKDGNFTIELFNDAGVSQGVKTIDVTGETTVEGLIKLINDAQAGVTASVDNGSIKLVSTDGKSTYEVKNGTSNIVTQMGFGKMDPTTLTSTSEVINYHQTIGEGNMGSDNSKNFTSVSINENGIIEVKYGNNDTLSVMQDPTDSTKMILKYTLNDGTIITGSDLTVNDQLVEPANLQIQMASFVNPQGLSAQGNNTYATGPNSGMVLYGSISSTAFGNVKSGVLEGSNVDLASEFADMVVSQRAIEANSRVFTTTNEILQTLSNLGR
jgi:fagellar hook-basal body proteins